MENITIKEVNQLVASDGKDEDQFGTSVALSSNGLVCIVGANSSDTKAEYAGKVYTYSRTTIRSKWKEVNQLTASDGRDSDFFGRSVALSSDGLVAIVGADGSGTKAKDAGKVYTYSRATIDDNWTEVNQLVASDGEEFDDFGSSVALSSNGLVAMVGAFGSNTKAIIAAGKVYTYSRDSINDNWKEVNQLVASDGDVFDNFGSSVALSSDGLVAIVGGYSIDTKVYSVGKVYTYSRNSINDNWKEVSMLTANDGEARDYFGISVALSSDGLVAMVGAFRENTKDTNAGKVYTYSRTTKRRKWKEVSILTASDGEAEDFFGSSVTLSSNGRVVLVGAIGSNTNTGKVYTYTINTNSK